MVSARNAPVRTPAISVDVGFTLTPGEVYIHGFQLGEEIDGYAAHFAHADAGGFHAAEGKLRLAADRGRVDVRDAGLDAIDELKDLGGVVRIKRAGQAITNGVSDMQGFVETAHANDGEDGAEDLLLRDGGVRRDVIENSRRNKIAAVVSAACEAFAAEHELAFFFTNLNVVKIGFELRLVNGGPHIDAWLKTISCAELGGAFHEELHEFVGDRFLNDDAAGGCAALAGGSEGAEDRRFHGKRQISVGKNHQRIFAAHFALAFLHTPRALRIKLAADFVRAGKGNSAYVGMLEQFVANLAARADDHVEHARGDARLLKNLNHSRACEWRERGGLEDDGVPSDQRRSNFPNGDRNGEIPGRDRRYNSKRLLERVSEVLWQLAGQGFAADATPLSGHKLQDIDGFLDFAERVLQGLAFFAGHQAREVVFLLLHQQRGFSDDAAAHGSRSFAPSGKCRAGGSNRLARFFALRGRREADDLVEIGGIAALRGSRRRRFDPPAVDKIAAGLGCRNRGRHALLHFVARSIRRGSVFGRARPRDFAVRLRPPIAIELPRIAHLLDFIQVQVGDKQLVLVAASLRDNFPARVAEVAFPVELADFPGLFRAHTIDGGDEISVGDGVRGLLKLPQVFGKSSDRGGRVVDNLGAVQAENARALRKVPVVADVHANPCIARLENRIAGIAGREIKFLPEARMAVRYVMLAILSEIAAIGVDHRRRVVVDAGHLHFVDRHHQHHLVLFCKLLHARNRRTVGHALRQLVPARLLFGAKVGTVEKLLQAQHLHFLLCGIGDEPLVLGDHFFFDFGE